MMIEKFTQAECDTIMLNALVEAIDRVLNDETRKLLLQEYHKIIEEIRHEK